MKKDKREPSLFTQAADKPARNSGKRTSSMLRRTAAEVTHYRLMQKVIVIGILVLFAFLLVLYGFALLYDRTGRFTVTVKNFDNDHSITLCEDEFFTSYNSILTNDKSGNSRPDDGTDIDPDDPDQVREGNRHQGLYRGKLWFIGTPLFSGFTTILPPNSKVYCSSIFARAASVIGGARSSHSGGVNASMMDGSVRFIADGVDTGDGEPDGGLDQLPKLSGNSPYGVWGAMGTANGGESKSL